MSGELSGTNEKTITSELIDSIIGSLSHDLRNDREYNARKFWITNRTALIGLGVTTVISLIRSAQDRLDLQAYYDHIVKDMTWQERIEFVSKGIEDLRKSNSQKIKQATIIMSLVQILPKVLPIILAAI